jgi:hypothetical protein
MSKKIIVDGAILTFPAAFGPIKFVPPIPPYRVAGSGAATIKNSKVCQLGDEKKVVITNTYITDSATIPGSVTITISSAETASYIFSAQPVIIAQKWTALCTVTDPAKIPTPPGPPVTQPMPPQSDDVPITCNPNDFVTVG